jgi:hypothetical protein
VAIAVKPISHRLPSRHLLVDLWTEIHENVRRFYWLRTDGVAIAVKPISHRRPSRHLVVDLRTEIHENVRGFYRLRTDGVAIAVKPIRIWDWSRSGHVPNLHYLMRGADKPRVRTIRAPGLFSVWVRGVGRWMSCCILKHSARGFVYVLDAFCLRIWCVFQNKRDVIHLRKVHFMIYCAVYTPAYTRLNGSAIWSIHCHSPQKVTTDCMNKRLSDSSKEKG